MKSVDFSGSGTSTSRPRRTGISPAPSRGQDRDRRSHARASVKESDDLWDGIVGIRGRIGLGSRKWGIPYYLDVGTGSSTFTMQAAAGIQYRWSWIDLNLVYR